MVSQTILGHGASRRFDTADCNTFIDRVLRLITTLQRCQFDMPPICCHAVNNYATKSYRIAPSGTPNAP
jgi:hypothetical protein